MSAVSDIVGGLFGGSQADAATESAQAQIQAAQMAIDEQRRAAAQGLGFLDPFAQLGQRAVGLSGFLADPQAQTDFLRDNPIFQLGLENLNQQTNQMAAAKGRLSAGDTLAQLQGNAMLAAQPLLDRQRQDISNLLNLGTGIAQSQANTALGVGSNVSNLLTDIGAARAGGIVGAANANQGGLGNIMGALTGGLMGSGLLGGAGMMAGGGLLGGGIGALLGLSDSRLKTNAEKIGRENGYDVWKWEWNKTAKEKFGLDGEATGVMVSDVIEKDPDAVDTIDGFARVNYSKIGVEPSWL